MIICAVSVPAFGHDGSVAFLSESDVLYAYEEEKLSRVHHAYNTRSERSFWSGLQFLELSLEDITHLVFVTLYNKSKNDIFVERWLIDTGLYSKKDKLKISYIGHHEAHAALAIFGSGFTSCSYLTIDGSGLDYDEVLSSRCGVFQHGKITEIAKSVPPSLGQLYGAMTHALGFSASEEGKVMGLSAYGNIIPEVYDILIDNLIFSNDDCTVNLKVAPVLTLKHNIEKYDYDNFRINKIKQFTMNPEIWGIKNFNYYSKPDIAATLQRVIEYAIVKIVTALFKKTKNPNIVLSGGIFYNVLVNDLIRKLPFIENIYIPMGAGDNGLSLGAGLLFQHKERKKELKKRSILTPYLGPSFSNQYIARTIAKFSLKHKYYSTKELTYETAIMLAEGKIVGWFQGRAEFGPRALGARSVLADPRNSESKNRLNQLLKKRDWFMPYAPSILEEYKDLIISDSIFSPYMEIAQKVKKEYKHIIPSAVHIDDSLRAQIVRKKLNPIFHSLITNFYKLTDIPVLLNTSFNVHGVPIVATPQQAIWHLLTDCIDVLVIENYIVYKEKEQANENDALIVSEDDALKYLNLQALRPILEAKENNIALQFIKDKFPNYFIECEKTIGTSRDSLTDEVINIISDKNI